MISNRKTTPLRTILQNCVAHIDKLEATRAVCDHYEKQFQDLKQFSENLKTKEEYACTEGEKEVNKKKNRYKDILPFNLSRVVLTEVDGVEGSSYVNANYIRGASGSPAYIASQGPLPNTVNDFWRMVVECEVQVIIMACNSEEAGKHKCENYWVERENEERTFGSVVISLVKDNVICQDFLVRTMRLKYTNPHTSSTEERTVCQFHYSAWPDHGVPPLVRPLLDMVRLVRDTQASETLPVLVHCSAGCGRTGTICAIDYVWGLLRLGKLSTEFSLFNLVRDMRKQRVAMVQTKEQYMLVHHAVRELFKEQLQIIDSHHYENVNPLGEPLYEALQTSLENGFTEKQDQNKLDILECSVREMIKSNAPPLPKKKNFSTPSSKHEKEVENITEKNRITSSLKLETSDNSLMRKPKIAKLKALFERGTPNVDRNGAKTKSHTISRSHSLGPVRNPLMTTVLKPSEVAAVKHIQSEPPIRSGGKLKVPKLMSSTPATSRPVPHVKRSKSLKIIKDTSPLLSLVQFASSDDLNEDIKKPEMTMSDPRQQPNRQVPVKEHDLYELRRRRSLESLMGEELPVVTWNNTINSKSRPECRDLDVLRSKNILSLKHQFQLFSHASQRTMNSLATGLGIRERRNSFRQAVSKDNLDRVGAQFGIEGRFISVPEDPGSSVYVDSSKPYRDMLTVRSQNGEILRPSQAVGNSCGSQSFRKVHRERQPTQRLDGEKERRPPTLGKETRMSSQSMRLPSKNRFLYKLKTELEHNGQYGPLEEYSTIRAYKLSPKSDGEIDRNNSASRVKNPFSNNHYRRSKHNIEQTKTLPEKVKLPLTRQLASDPDYIALKDTRTPNHRVLVNHRHVSPAFSSPYAIGEENNSKPYLASHLARPGKSSSASSQSSDNLSDYYKKSSTFSPGCGLRRSTELNRIKPEVGSESSSSSGARELNSVMRRVVPAQQREIMWSVIGRSKSSSRVLEEVNRCEPVAPPRVRRRSSARNPSHESSHHSNSQVENKAWCESLGVDLDAVAASLLRTDPTSGSGVKTVLSDKEQSSSLGSVPSAANVTSFRKQQYL